MPTREAAPGRHRQRHGRRPRRRGDPRARRRRAVPDHDVRRRAVRQLQPDHALPRAPAGDGRPTRSTSTRWTGTPRTTSRCTPACGSCASTGSRSKVFGNDGTIEPYDKLIIATGSRTFFPPMDGMWVDDKTLTPGVFGFRTLDDTTAMLDYAAEQRTAVVIGGGLLGLEAAYGLMQHGHEVHVVQSGPVLMNQQLDEEAGGILRKVLERHGHARPHRASGPPRSARRRRRERAWCSRTAAPSTATWSWSPPASGPTSASASCPA